MRYVLALAVGLLPLGCDDVIGADFSDLHDQSLLQSDASLGDASVVETANDAEVLDVSQPADSGAEASDDAPSDAPSDAKPDAGQEDTGQGCIYNPLGVDQATMENCVVYWRSHGGEMTTLTAYDDGAGGTLFAAAFVKATAPNYWDRDLTAELTREAIVKYDVLGYRPAQISGYGSPLRYAVLWIPKLTNTIAEIDVPWDTFTSEYDVRAAGTWILVSAEVYWDGTQDLYAPIWVDVGVKNEGSILYSFNTVADLDAYDRTAGLPLISIAALHEPNFNAVIGVWYFLPGKWTHKPDEPLANMQGLVNAQRKAGLQLRHISASGVGDNALFAATWSDP